MVASDSSPQHMPSHSDESNSANNNSAQRPSRSFSADSRLTAQSNALANSLQNIFAKPYPPANFAYPFKRNPAVAGGSAQQQAAAAMNSQTEHLFNLLNAAAAAAGNYYLQQQLQLQQQALGGDVSLPAGSPQQLQKSASSNSIAENGFSKDQISSASESESRNGFASSKNGDASSENEDGTNSDSKRSVKRTKKRKIAEKEQHGNGSSEESAKKAKTDEKSNDSTSSEDESESEEKPNGENGGEAKEGQNGTNSQKKKINKRNKRKNIKEIISEDQLEKKTKDAQAEEQERLRRLQEQRKQQLEQQFLAQYNERRKKDLMDLQRQQEQIIQLSSSEDELMKATSQSAIKVSSDSDDIKILSGAEMDLDDDDEEAEDPNNSGMHVDDRLNVPDEQGRVLVNVGHNEKDAAVYLAPQLSKVVKPHQIGGIRFLYDNIIESPERYRNSPGFGCILAHSMGLGKTIQVVSFCDVFLRHTDGKHVLCIVPINTIQNWQNEFNMWIPAEGDVDPSKVADGRVRPRNFAIHVLNDAVKNLEQRNKVIIDWRRNGGVLLMGYELYRQLANKKTRKKAKPKKGFECIDLEEEDKTKNMLDVIYRALVDPGPDLVICDEGHRIKNSQATISQCLKTLRTKRRVALTGYPLQNNLMEYWCMVDFVRPNFLGNKTEFSNMFERPIENGQCSDSTPRDARLMMHRAHVLHTQLKGFVQRRSHRVLQLSLPKKNEHVLLLKLTSFQRRLYRRFKDELVYNKSVANPLKAFAVCCKIWNHPDVLHTFLKNKKDQEDFDLEWDELYGTSASMANQPKNGKQQRGRKANSANSAAAALAAAKPPYDMGFMGQEPGFNPFAAMAPLNGLNGRKEEINYDWAQSLMSDYAAGVLEMSAKFQVFFRILDETVKVGDRILLFSQSLQTLNLIEEFLQKRKIPGSSSRWAPGVNYFRLDGSTPAQERERLINLFNESAKQDEEKYDTKKSIQQNTISSLSEKPGPPRIPLFMVSTKAGSLGINLIGANRVVVLDASWNPCHDSQAVCRVYRYGQTKTSFIYRLISDNTIEKKIYDRQVNKQGMADRVVDESNPDNFLHSKDIRTLIVENEEDPPGALVVEDEKLAQVREEDPVLASVLAKCGHLLTKDPFTHESLLVDRKEKKLTKYEKRLAERMYAQEKGSKVSYTRPSYAAFYPTKANENKASPQPPPQSSSYNFDATSGSSAAGGVPFPASYFHSNQGGAVNVPSTQPPPLPLPPSLQQTEKLPNSSVNNVPKPAALPSSVPPPQQQQQQQQSNRLESLLKTLSPARLKAQGITSQEIIVPRDLLIPNNQKAQPVKLAKGQRVVVYSSPKGIYLPLGGNMVKLNGLLPDAATVPQPRLVPSDKPKEVVTLSDSSSDNEKEKSTNGTSTQNGGTATNGNTSQGTEGGISGTKRALLDLVASASNSSNNE